jgi:uncharacterized MnhB-related membrane protein
MAGTSLDLALAAILIWIAWRAGATAELFNAVVLFIVFGLLMTLAWVRLNAPDIALAETAIGTGLTGALMLDAVARISAKRGRRRARRNSS